MRCSQVLISAHLVSGPQPHFWLMTSPWMLQLPCPGNTDLDCRTHRRMNRNVTTFRNKCIVNIPFTTSSQYKCRALSHSITYTGTQMSIQASHKLMKVFFWHPGQRKSKKEKLILLEIFLFLNTQEELWYFSNGPIPKWTVQTIAQRIISRVTASGFDVYIKQYSGTRGSYGRLGSRQTNLQGNSKPKLLNNRHGVEASHSVPTSSNVLTYWQGLEPKLYRRMPVHQWWKSWKLRLELWQEMEKHDVRSGLPCVVCCRKYLESDFVYEMGNIYTFTKKTS